MKKPFVVGLMCLFIMSCVGCVEIHNSFTVNTSPTAQAENTAARSTDYSAEPAASPVPSTSPESVILSFDECAEEVLSLKPYRDSVGPLPSDSIGDNVLYIINNGGDVSDLGPRWFATDGKIIAIYDMCGRLSLFDRNKLTLCSELNSFGSSRYAVLSNDHIYTPNADFSLESGEIGRMLEFDNTDPNFLSCIVSAHDTSTGPQFLLSESIGLTDLKETAIVYNYYSLDDHGTWQSNEPLCTLFESYDGDRTRIVLQNGTQTELGYCCLTPLGMDTLGNTYFVKSSRTDTIVVVGPEGYVIKQMEIPIDDSVLWEPAIQYRLMTDGVLYIAAAMIDSYTVWRIQL